MATKDEYSALINLGFESKEAQNLAKSLETMLKAVDAFPDHTKVANKSLSDMIGLLKQAGQQIKSGGLNDASDALRAVGGQLKAIKTLAAGLEVFSSKEIQQINAAANALRAAAKAAEQVQKNAQVQKGVFGLDTNNVRDAGKALKTLQENLKGVQGLALNGKASAEMKAQADALERNIKALQNHVVALRDSAKAEADARKDQAHWDKLKEQSAKAEAARQKAAAVNQINTANTENKSRKQRAKDAERLMLEQAHYENKIFDSRKKAEEKNMIETAHRANRMFDTQKKVAERQMLEQAHYENRIFDSRKRAEERNMIETAQRANRVFDAQRKATEKNIWEQAIAENRAFDQRKKLQEKAHRDDQRNIDKLKELNAKQSDGRVLASNMRYAFANSEDGRKAYQSQAQYQIGGIQRFATVPDFFKAKVDSRAAADQNLILKTQAAQHGLKLSDAKVSQEVMLIRQKMAQVEKDIQQELAKGLVTSQRMTDLTKERAKLQGQEKLQVSREKRSDRYLREAEEESRKQGMMSRVTGSGGAALLAAQAALMANYSIINGVTGAIGNGVRASIELEQAFRNVQAVTAVTSVEMEGLEKKIMSVAGTSRFTSKEVADAALTLGQAGLSVKEITEALPSVVQLATAAGTTLAQAVDLVTSVVGVFDKKASDTADVANKITQASNSSKISVDKLSLALQYAGNAAAQTGVSFEETLAVLSAMANAGIRSGSTMGTGLRQFLTEIQKPSEEMISTLTRIGLTISDLDIRSNGLIGVIQKLQRAGFVAGDSIRSFDVRGAAAFNALLANPADLSRQYDMLLKTEAASKASEIQMNSLDSQFKRFTTTVTNLVSTAIKPFQEALTTLFSAAATVLTPLSQIPGILTIMIGAATAFVGVKLISHFAGVVGGLLQMVGVAPGVLAFFSGLKTATLAQTAVGQAMATSNIAVTASVISTGVAASTTTSLLVGLRTALMGLSMFHVVGIAIAAASAALYLFTSSGEKSKKTLEELQAKADEARATFSNKEATVKSLTTKIEDLQYAEKNLGDGTENLKRTVRELNSQFGNLGLRLDELEPKYANVIRGMRAMRNEIRSTMGAALSNQILAEGKVVETQTEDFNKQRSDRFSQGDFRRLGRYMKETDLNKLDPIARNAVETIYRQASSKDATVAQVAELATLFQLLDPITKDKAGFAATRERFAPLTTKALELSASTAKLQGTSQQAKNFASETRLITAPIFNLGGRRTGTLEEAMPPPKDLLGSVRDRMKKENPNVTSLEILRAGKVEAEAALKRFQSLQEAVRQSQPMLNLTNEETERQVSLLKSREGDYSSNYIKNAKTEENRARLEMQNELATLSARSKNKKLTPEQRKAARTQMAGVQNEFESLFILGDSANQNLRYEQLLRRRTEEANSQESGREVGDANAAARAAAQEREDALKMGVKTYATQAKTVKMNAKGLTDWNEIDAAIETGVSYLTKSHAKQLELLAEEQANSKAKGPGVEESFRTQREELLLTQKEELEQYRLSYNDYYTKGIKTSLKMREMVDLEAGKLEYENFQQAQKAKLFEAGQEVNAVAMEIASGTRPAGTTREKQAALQFTQTQIESLEEQLRYLGDGVSGYIGSLVTEVHENVEAIKKLENDLKKPDLSPGVRSAIEGQIIQRQGYGKQLQGELRGARQDRQGAIEARQGLQLQAAGQNQAMPQAMTWENLSKRMETVANNYRMTVENFDQLGEITAGVEGSLAGLSGTFSTFFTNLTSGTMSAKDAFKGMAKSIIGSLMEIIAKMIAFGIVKQLVGFAMGSTTGNAAVDAGTYKDIPVGNPQFGAATGGIVSGGIQGKDSVSAMLMPGEAVLNTKAVAAVGEEFVHSLNQNSQTYMSQSAKAERMDAPKGDKMVNVWVVTPDQQPGSMGPQDVVVTVADNLVNRGTLRQLVKQISMGQM